MGPRNLLILFFSTVAVSLVILIIFFSLFFKNVNLDFNTRLPESAPDIGSRFNASSTMSPDSKANGLSRSTVNVPPDYKEPEGGSQAVKDKAAPEETLPNDIDLPPISDDALLERDYPPPLPEKTTESPDKTAPGERASTRPAPAAPAPKAPRVTEQRKEPQPASTPPAIEDVPSSEPAQSGPPIPQ